MDKFAFQEKRREKLAEILARTRPKLDGKRIIYFLNKCEREIEDWLSWWPEGTTKSSKGTLASLHRVEKAATALHLALKGLDCHTNFILNAYRISKMDCGVSKEEVNALSADSESFAMNLVLDTQNCQSWQDAPLSDRRKEDLAHRVVKSYIKTFQKKPSANTEGIFSEFLGEMAESINIKHRGNLKIGRKVIETAIERNEEYLPGGCYVQPVQRENITG